MELLNKRQYPAVPEIDELVKGASWTQEQVCEMCGIKYPPQDYQEFNLARLVLKERMEHALLDSVDGQLLSITTRHQKGGLLICEDEDALCFNERQLKAIRRAERKTLKRLHAVDHGALSLENQQKLDRMRLEASLRNQDARQRMRKLKQEEKLIAARAGNIEKSK